jgi:hypothetical protein
MTTEDLDAVVLGASIRGLVAAHVLARLGRRAVVLERSSRVGGADGSFETPGGTTFDNGFHVLDHMRSPEATRLFTEVVDGEVNRLELRRGIVLRGRLMPYAPRPGEMPAELRDLLAGDDLTDRVGDELPTRERLGRCYGPGFADLVMDEVLPSFPTEHRHHRFGVDEARLLTNVYPWFFPRATQAVASGDESRAFHDRLRAGATQEILYPARGGFGGFAAGFVDKLERDGIEVRTGLGEIQVEVSPHTHRVEWVEAGGRRLGAERYLWGQGWAPLCALLDLPCQEVATDRIALGSFRLDRPPRTDYHEILVGDPRVRINRVSFPDALRGSAENLMQIEFAFPDRAEGWDLEAEEWRRRWIEDGRAIGVLDQDHRVEEFDFRSFRMHYNAFGAEGEPLRDADPSLLNGSSNLHPIAPSMANLNLNRYVPRALEEVSEALGAPGAPAA